MSLISFIQDAGEKLFGHQTAAPAAAPAATPAPTPQPTAATQAALPDTGALGVKSAQANQAAATAIEGYIRAQKLDANGLKVAYDGATRTVSVSGQAPDQATREKIVLCCGNVQGVANVNDQLTVAQAADASRYYTVVRGDTLSAVAKSQYGNGNDYMKIFEANKPMLSSPDKIYPGQVLRIPA